MKSGFFWKVPNTDRHYIYTNTGAQMYLDANFKEPPAMGVIRQWDSIPMADKIALLLLQGERPENAGEDSSDE